jgi:NADH:ubiquinone oxidoreductase subunit C
MSVFANIQHSFLFIGCISAVDNGVASENRFEVLSSVFTAERGLFIIKVFAEENNEGIPSIRR